jgi:YegS/Rv2252/BmrU family lipid kinase
MTEEKWVFIVNPVAGNGFAGHYLPKLKAMIEAHDIRAEIVFTEYAGHAEKLAEEFVKAGYVYVIAVGGDGTMNEICRALINRPGITTGIIPAGTGNDFVQILGFSDRFREEDWDIFFSKPVRNLDTGNCNGRIFLNGMGIGFDAQVAAENYDEHAQVKKGGKGKYIWHIVKTLFFFREKKVLIDAGNGPREFCCFIHTISIGRRFAGGFFLTPRAVADDGMLDICMIERIGLLRRLRILLMVPHGTHVNNPRVKYYQTPGISLRFPEKVPYHLDGELFFDERLEVKVNPASLRIIYNPKGPHFFRQEA